MTRVQLIVWLASQRLSGNTVNLVLKHELIAQAEIVWDYLARSQYGEAKLHLQKIFIDRLRNSKRIHSHKNSQSLEQRQIPDEDRTSNIKTVIVTGTNTEPQDLSFLGDINPSSFPRCDPCFRRRRKCDGGRPCQSCRGQYGDCRNVTLKSLKEFPEFARYVLTGEKRIKPRKPQSLIIDRSSFPKSDVCFRRGHKCDGGRPCQHCQMYRFRCLDVATESLERHPDRAIRLLKRTPQAPASHSPCRYCVYNGRICYRESSADACETCIRYGGACHKTRDV
jgi:Fungal Zn(2)-Cys(6) binuclear cluster domain